MSRRDSLLPRPLVGSCLTTWILSTLFVSGCNDFKTPAQLEKTTVLAVIADPPVVAPGQKARLAPVVVDPQGPVAAPTATWRLVEALPGIAPMGTIEGQADGSAIYTAPAEVPARPASAPPLDRVEVEIAASPRPIVAVKAMVVAGIPAHNPEIAKLRVDGADAAEPIVLRRDQTAALEVEIAPAADDEATFAWYATVGDIAAYQSSPTEIVAPNAPATGWLFVVVRDGRGGVAWRAAHVTVE